ncbi:MAG: BtpA/SgcQ family protein [Chthoniobacterales bacterium]
MKTLIGMIHLAALPGTPQSQSSVNEITRRAVAEVRIYREAGFSAVLIENMHDTPYLARNVGPEIVAAMTICAQAVRAEFPGKIGLQILAGANEAALAVAFSCELQFIRAEAFTFGHVADEGWMDACAGPLLRYRRAIGADAVEVWTDIKKKHASHAMTADISLAETAAAAEYMGASAVIVTGRVTGDAPNLGDFENIRSHTALPVVIGSGVSESNLTPLWPLADAFIVGSSLKKGGHWCGELDPRAVDSLARTAGRLTIS